ncbi:hypothetical protein F9C07_2280442 [Aspergillus flavus]|uniref:Capsule polysaccharide biosynthesis protein n=2 Tax=Aspergillus flavus TaxID=5059 RepID=A0A7U2MX57_ASPFN|nr:hypothetical protein F9C07_2280442 [Aspergillus flavus]RAQ59659.1 hypothetical protein COH20_002002 [Aspergillus flavus]RAQ76865.1 hypothetical protein COH21_008663 [Aspergillus flavus]RMZ48200.1 hypothetical protein CA14_008472 [Aspergillus flavus]UDD63841.1 hypothetical protein AFCA_011095 [Aspergillus flavus]
MSAYSFLSALGGILLLFFVYDSKAIPGLWHARVIAILMNHLVWKRNQSSISSSDGPSVLFRPLRTRSYCSLAEVDFNLHKSNSTFYADLDISRIELLLLLFKDVITPLSPPSRYHHSGGPYKSDEQQAGSLKHLTPALGGVSCIFRREIKPWQRYDVESRILCWDDKWLYIVSHFLKPGSHSETGTGGSEEGILASAISKYVFKKGRRTVTPEEVLQFLHLVEDGDHADADADANANADAYADASIERSGLGPKVRGQGDQQEHIEVKRKRGLALAAHMAGLDGLHRVA